MPPRAAAQQSTMAPPSSPPPPQQGTKRGAEDDDDDKHGAKRPRQDSAAPAATTAPPPPPKGTKRKSQDAGGRSSKQQKTGGTSARQLELLRENLFLLEERRDRVAGQYQDLPLAVRRDVRHMHGNEQFVLAALLQHITTPYAAAALPDVEAELPIAELCPRDDHLLRESKQAVGEAAARGDELTPVLSQLVLDTITAANARLEMIEAMVARLKRSYAESTTRFSERAMVLAWNVVCQQIQRGDDVNDAYQYVKQFLEAWAALDDLVATKNEERRFFS